MKVDWITQEGYQQRVEYFQRLRAVIEELQFLDSAAEILELNKICFLDFDSDSFPRINLKRTEPEDENNTEDLC